MTDIEQIGHTIDVLASDVTRMFARFPKDRLMISRFIRDELEFCGDATESRDGRRAMMAVLANIGLHVVSMKRLHEER